MAWSGSVGPWLALRPPTPATILRGKLLLDLDSDRSVTMGIGTRVATWTSDQQSGAAVGCSQGVMSKQPTRLLSDLDGHAAIRYTRASAQCLVSPTGAWVGPAQLSLPYVACVIKVHGYDGDNGMVVETSDGDAFNRGLAVLTQPSQTLTGQGRCGGFSFTASVAQAPVAPAALLIESWIEYTDRTRLHVWVNNSSYAPGNVPLDFGMTWAQSKLFIGVLANQANYFLDASIYRIVIAGEPLTAAERSTLLAFYRATYPSIAIA